MAKEGGGSSTIISNPAMLSKPLNLIQAVSEIQQMGSIEKNMAEVMDKDYFPIGMQLDFMSVGFKNTLTHLLLSLFFTPITIGVLDDLIPIFGDVHFNAIDYIYAILLSFSMSIGFGLFLTQLKRSYVGTITKNMIKYLFTGLILGEALKVFICAIVYNLIYTFFTPEKIYKIVYYFQQHTLLTRMHLDNKINYVDIFNWMVHFRNVFPVATVFVLIASLVMVLPPVLAIVIHVHMSKVSKDLENL